MDFNAHPSLSVFSFCETIWKRCVDYIVCTVRQFRNHFDENHSRRAYLIPPLQVAIHTGVHHETSLFYCSAFQPVGVPFECSRGCSTTDLSARNQPSTRC